MKILIPVLSLIAATAFANDGGTKSKNMEHPKNMADHSGQAEMQKKSQMPSGKNTSKNVSDKDMNSINPDQGYNVQPGSKKKEKAQE